LPSAAESVRLLEQTTFGPSEALIGEVQSKGFVAFVDDQLAAAPSSLGSFNYVDSDSNAFCAKQPDPEVCFRDNYSAFPLQRQFFVNGLTDKDQLRLRVALALSQIFVVSPLKVEPTYGIAGYQQMLIKDAFGNVRQLLADVTLHPVMGSYLDMVNNEKPDPAGGSPPNENYARELLQLFSIGTVKLNLDGTTVVGTNGQPLPAYDQDIIEGFSHVFTGWTYPTRAGAVPQFYNPVNLDGRMEPFPDHHDMAAKRLLSGVSLPAGQSPEKDLNDALDNVFAHPNVAPFLSKQLIQHLVTSNPTPAYVARVAAVFTNNGQGVRGDLKAVVRAIVLDPEARGEQKTEADYGKIREPALYILGLLRAFGGRTDGVAPAFFAGLLGQDVFSAPSVFNFYSPTYRLPGTGILSPPSQLQNTATILIRANVTDLLLSAPLPPEPSVAGATGTALDLTPLDAVANDSGRLLDKLTLLMTHNTLSPDGRATLEQAVASIPASDPHARVLMATYLLATSSQYQVER
jgi:hypothetical protein